MWKTKSKGSTDITMTEGDYGVSLPFPFSGVLIDSADSVKLTVKENADDETAIIEKDFTGILKNTVDLVFTAAESALLDVGTYVYSMDWYKNGVFQYCLIENAKLKVANKI